MAICYSAPLTLTSLRLPTNRSCSLLSDSRTPIRTSKSMHLESKQAIKFPVLAIRNLFSSENKKKNLFESVIVASSRRVEPETVTEETWEECVLKSDVPVLVEFWASWCGPCKMVHREIEEIAEEYAGKIKFYMLRADEEVQVAEKYGVKAVPIVMLFKNGEKESSVIGTMPKEIYISAIEKLLTP